MNDKRYEEIVMKNASLLLPVLLSLLFIGCATSELMEGNPPEVRADNGTVARVSWDRQETFSSKNTERDKIHPLGTDDQGREFRLIERRRYFYGAVVGVKRRIELAAPDGTIVAEYELEGNGLNFHGLYVRDDRFIVLSDSHDKATSMKNLDILEVSKADLTANRPRTVASVPCRNVFLGVTSSIYRIAERGDRIFAVNIAPKGDRDSLGEIHLFEFDRDFNLVNSRVYDLDYVERLFIVEDLDITAEGDVRIMGVAYNEKRQRYVDGKANFDYVFVSFADDFETRIERVLGLEDRTIRSMRFMYHPGGDIVCVGFYSDNIGVFQSGVTGSFLMTLDIDDAHTELANCVPFDTEFRSRLMSDRREESGKDLRSANIKRIYRLEDESVLLLGEISAQSTMAMTYTTRDYNPGTDTVTVTTTTYYSESYWHGPVIAMRMSPEGERLWSAVIRKDQRAGSENSAFLSYSPLVSGDTIYLIYNDLPVNHEGTVDDVEPFWPHKKKSGIIWSIIEGNGEVDSYALYYEEGDPLRIVPEECYPISESEMAIYGQKKTLGVWGTISFME